MAIATRTRYLVAINTGGPTLNRGIAPHLDPIDFDRHAPEMDITVYNENIREYCKYKKKQLIPIRIVTQELDSEAEGWKVALDD